MAISNITESPAWHLLTPQGDASKSPVLVSAPWQTLTVRYAYQIVEIPSYELVADIVQLIQFSTESRITPFLQSTALSTAIAEFSQDSAVDSYSQIAELQSITVVDVVFQQDGFDQSTETAVIVAGIAEQETGNFGQISTTGQTVNLFGSQDFDSFINDIRVRIDLAAVTVSTVGSYTQEAMAGAYASTIFNTIQTVGNYTIVSNIDIDVIFVASQQIEDFEQTVEQLSDITGKDVFEQVYDYRQDCRITVSTGFASGIPINLPVFKSGAQGLGHRFHPRF